LLAHRKKVIDHSEFRDPLTPDPFPSYYDLGKNLNQEMGRRRKFIEVRSIGNCQERKRNGIFITEVKWFQR